jgi:putative MATE family efflux protein
MSLQTETRPGILVAIRDAIRGDSHRDFTQGSIGRAIFLLSLPMVLEMSMESLFAVVDMFWVAHLGSDAVATIALTEAVLTLLFAIAMGLSMATTAMVARRIGEKNLDGATEVATQSILLGVVIAGVLGAAGLYFAEDVLRIMGASPSILKTGTNYTRVIYGGSASVMLLFLINAVFRGAGDAALAMRALWIANIINIVLNPCLIFGLGPFPKMGVTGSGVGTTVGRTGGSAASNLVSDAGTQPRGGSFAPDSSERRGDAALVKLSIGGTFQYFVAVASWIALVRMAATFGSVAVAGYGVALRIVIFALLPSWGMSNAAATLVGQNLGAKRPDRAEQSVWRAGFYNMVFLGLISIAFIVFATPWFRSSRTTPG